MATKPVRWSRRSNSGPAAADGGEGWNQPAAEAAGHRGTAPRRDARYPPWLRPDGGRDPGGRRLRFERSGPYAGRPGGSRAEIAAFLGRYCLLVAQ